MGRMKLWHFWSGAGTGLKNDHIVQKSRKMHDVFSCRILDLGGEYIDRVGVEITHKNNYARIIVR